MRKNAFLFLTGLALVGCNTSDLPAGWEDAVRVEGLTQHECKGSALDEDTKEILTATATKGGFEIAYDAAHFRCAQDVEGYARTTAHSVDLLVQPVDMNPSAVAGCDCLYDIEMTIDGLDQGAASVALYRRWDNQNTPNEPVKVGSAMVEVR